MWAKLVGPEAIWGVRAGETGFAPAWTDRFDMEWSKRNILFLVMPCFQRRPSTNTRNKL